MRESVKHALTESAILEASLHLPAGVKDTPQFEHDGLTALTGKSVIVKCETVNPVGCFKARGTWTAVRLLRERGLIGAKRGVTAATAGNFGIGLAYAARAFGVEATVFVAEGANARKVERMRLIGARVVCEGRDGDDALDAASRFAEEHGAYFLKDGKEPLIAVGAGTLGVELTTAAERGAIPRIDAIYVPTGGGSLLAGIGAWFRSASPATRVIGIQAENAPALTLSWRAKAYVETPTCDTCADGLAMRRPIPEALDLIEGLVDDFVLVSEDEIREAQAVLTAELGITVEPSAAASLAGMSKAGGDEQAAVLVVTGSNVVQSSEGGVR